MDYRIVLVLDCTDPERLASFWASALGYRKSASDEPYIVLVPDDPSRPDLVLQRVAEPKTVKNRMHLDIRVKDLKEALASLEELGATRLSQEVIEEAGFRWVVMADPEGNEFCVGVEPPF